MVALPLRVIFRGGVLPPLLEEVKAHIAMPCCSCVCDLVLDAVNVFRRDQDAFTAILEIRGRSTITWIESSTPMRRAAEPHYRASLQSLITSPEIVAAPVPAKEAQPQISIIT